jgi:hypothetical protein
LGLSFADFSFLFDNLFDFGSSITSSLPDALISSTALDIESSLLK